MMKEIDVVMKRDHFTWNMRLTEKKQQITSESDHKRYQLVKKALKWLIEFQKEDFEGRIRSQEYYQKIRLLRNTHILTEEEFKRLDT